MKTSEMGLCWSKTTDNPTIANFKTVKKGATKVFTQAIDYLEPETTYSVRAYVIQKGQPQYSHRVVFKTLGKPILKEEEL